LSFVSDRCKKTIDPQLSLWIQNDLAIAALKSDQREQCNKLLEEVKNAPAFSSTSEKFKKAVAFNEELCKKAGNRRYVIGNGIPGIADEIPGTGRYVPDEFKNGTATLENVKDWSGAYWADYHTSGEKQPGLEFMSLDASSEKLVLAMVGKARNSSYFVFKKTPAGYKYVGDLHGSNFYRLYYPETGNAYVLITWHMGRGEMGLSLMQLRDDKLQNVGRGITLQQGLNENEKEKILVNDKEAPQLAKFVDNLFDKLRDNKISEPDLRQIFDLK
jgi:hypothetical protein